VILLSNNKDIVATFIVTSRGSPIETQKVVESYTSTTSEHNLLGMLHRIAEVVVSSDRDVEAYARSLEDRVLSYGSKMTDPVQLGSAKNFKVDVRVPSDALDWDLDGVPHLLVRFAGNIFRTTEASGIKWVDITFPPGYLERYDWARPKYGISGIKDFYNISQNQLQPLIGSTIQPNIGLTANEFAILAQNSVKWGADIVIEDEMLGDLPVARLRDRIIQVTDRLEQLGKKSMYLVNIMGWSDFIVKELPNMLKSLNLKNKNVLCGIMLDPVYGGFSLLKNFRRDAECPIFCHYYSISLFIRNSNFGISTKVLSSLATLSGADFVYVGHVTGRHIAEAPLVLNYVAKTLRENNVYPAISGGINVSNVIANLRSLGLDTLVQSASGIYGHPLGPKSGFKALREMINLCKEKCAFCNHDSISQCSGFFDLLKKTTELQVLFSNSLPEINPSEQKDNND